MKKLLLLMGVFLISFQATYAQKKAENVEVKWTKEKKSKKNFYTGGIFAVDETGYYMQKITGLFRPKTYFQHYDKNFNLDKSYELKLGKGKKQKQALNVLHLNNKLFFFTSYKNIKNKKHDLYVQTVNKKTLAPNKDIRKLATIDFTKKSRRNAGEYTILISRDSTKVLVYYNLPYKKNEKEKFGFHVYDSNMNEIWKKDITLPYIDKLFIIKDFVIDNNGTVHIIGKVYNKKARNKRKGKVNYKYQILSYYNNGADFKKYDIRLKGKFVKDIIITVNDDNDIICAGFYSDDNKDSVKGTYFIKINHETKDIMSESYKKFDANFLTQYLSKGKKKRVKRRIAKGKKVELYHYDLDDIVIKSDGGAVLVGEYYNVVARTTTSTVNGHTTTRTVYYYYFGNIIAINISPEGTILWARKVPKNQVSVNTPGFYTSYAKMITNDKIHFIYNDNPKNLTTTKNKKGRIYALNSPKKSVITVSTIDMDGKLSRGIIPKPKKSKIYILPRVSTQLDDDTMVLFGQRGRKYRFARLIFKD